MGAGICPNLDGVILTRRYKETHLLGSEADAGDALVMPGKDSSALEKVILVRPEPCSIILRACEEELPLVSVQAQNDVLMASTGLLDRA